LFAEIEKKIQQRIEDKITSIRDVDIQKGVKGALINPAVAVSVEEGSFEQRGQKSFKTPTTVYVEIEFKNLRSEEDRRKGSFPILLAIIQFLMLQEFDLGIDPLMPVRWRNVTDDEDFKKAIMRVQIIFKTGFTITKTDEEAADDLLRVGLNYYLKPGDDVADISDLLTLQEGG